ISRFLRFSWGTLIMLVLVGFSLSFPASELKLIPPPSSPKIRGAGLEPMAQAERGQSAYRDPKRPCLLQNQTPAVAHVLFTEAPQQYPERWLDDLNMALFELGVPCNQEEFLVLVLTTIQLESAVRSDPALENANLESLFEYKLAQLRDSSLFLEPMLNQSGLVEGLRAKLRADTRTGKVRTEGDLGRYVEGDLRVWLAERLTSEYFIPGPVARFTAEQALVNPVSTIGPMQVNVHKAYRNARRRGEAVSGTEAMQRLLLDRGTALYRGLKEGIYMLWRGFSFYSRYVPVEEAIQYTTADYNAGEFSSRNAAFQARVSEMSRHKLTLDGDLLLYDGDQPRQRVSNTESAILTLKAELTPHQVREDLKLEKEPEFITTTTYLKVCELYSDRLKKPCQVAMVPSGAVNVGAQLKLGRAYGPANYARAYLTRWKENLELYRAAKLRDPLPTPSPETPETPDAQGRIHPGTLPSHLPEGRAALPPPGHTKGA
ncbi:MAG: DUF1615 domain-containing protein, partial [Deltaproteobacteria bacterium]|nr:DUF1615 domain-containing protein [Deltaproteobacteria bacterium]